MKRKSISTGPYRMSVRSMYVRSCAGARTVPFGSQTTCVETLKHSSPQCLIFVSLPEISCHPRTSKDLTRLWYEWLSLRLVSMAPRRLDQRRDEPGLSLWAGHNVSRAPASAETSEILSAPRANCGAWAYTVVLAPGLNCSEAQAVAWKQIRHGHPWGICCATSAETGFVRPGNACFRGFDSGRW